MSPTVDVTMTTTAITTTTVAMTTTVISTIACTSTYELYPVNSKSPFPRPRRAKQAPITATTTNSQTKTNSSMSTDATKATPDHFVGYHGARYNEEYIPHITITPSPTRGGHVLQRSRHKYRSPLPDFPVLVSPSKQHVYHEMWFSFKYINGLRHHYKNVSVCLRHADHVIVTSEKWWLYLTATFVFKATCGGRGGTGRGGDGLGWVEGLGVRPAFWSIRTINTQLNHFVTCFQQK